MSTKEKRITTFHLLFALPCCSTPDDYSLQVYKGEGLECSFPVSSYDKPHDARVRCWALCTVNGREEQIWSPFSPTVHCQCILETETETSKVVEEPDSPVQEGKPTIGGGLSTQTLVAIVFVLVSLLILLVSFVLGQYVV